MMLTTVNAFLILLVCLASITNMVLWHVTGKGAWRAHKAGRAIMSLLGIIAVITGLAAFSIFVGPFPYRSTVYIVLYSYMLFVLLNIGSTILSIQRVNNPER